MSTRVAHKTDTTTTSLLCRYCAKTYTFAHTRMTPYGRERILTLFAALHGHGDQAVPPDAPVSPYAAADMERGLNPCGTHAAFVRHRSRGEVPCDTCWSGERAYQRGRVRHREPAAVVRRRAA